MLRLTAAFVAGLLAGIFLWQQSVVSKLESENQKLREQSAKVESLLAENARLASSFGGGSVAPARATTRAIAPPRNQVRTRM